MVPLGSMRRNVPFPQVPGATAELCPSQQLQQKEAAGSRVMRTMRVKSCVGKICPLVERENIFPSLCACLTAWAVLILRRWYDSSHWFWKPDNYSVTKFPLFPLKGEKWEGLFSENVWLHLCSTQGIPVCFSFKFSDFGGLCVGYKCHYIKIFPSS